MTENRTMQENEPRKGVALKLLGVVLIILGVLDSMLSWRGGFAASGSYALLMAFGVFLYALGSIRSRSRT